MGGSANRIIYGADGSGRGGGREGKVGALKGPRQVFDAGVGEIRHQAISTLPALTSKGVHAEDGLGDIVGALDVRKQCQREDEAGNEATEAVD